MLALVLRDALRTIHVLAGGLWVGGSLVYLLVITPALRLGKAAPEVSATIARLFRRMVNISIGALLVSGMYLTFDRLTTVTVGTTYVVVLVLKVAVALGMFVLALYQAQEARRLAKYRGRMWYLAPRLILALGVLAFLLGTILTGLYESALVPHP